MTLRRAVSVEDRSHTGVGSGWSGRRNMWQLKRESWSRDNFFFFLSRREAAYINIENAPIKRNKLMIQESVVNC